MPENPYQTPRGANEQAVSQHTSGWFDKFTLITRHTILLLSFAVLLLFIMPFYVTQYELLEFKLSANLTYLVVLSKWVSTYWYLAAIGIPLYFVVLLRVRPKTPFQRVIFAAWSLLFWIFAIGIFLFAAFHLATPMISITTGLAPPQN